MQGKILIRYGFQGTIQSFVVTTALFFGKHYTTASPNSLVKKLNIWLAMLKKKH